MDQRRERCTDLRTVAPALAQQAAVQRVEVAASLITGVSERRTLRAATLLRSLHLTSPSLDPMWLKLSAVGTDTHLVSIPVRKKRTLVAAS